MNNIPELFLETVRNYPDNPLIWEKTDGKYEPTSYTEALIHTKKLAKALLSIGMKKDDKVILYCEGRNWWLFSELAILFNGAVSVPISIKLEEAEDLHFRISHSESRFIICSIRRLQNIRKVVDANNKNIKIIIIDLPKKNDEFELRENEILLSSLINKDLSNISELDTEITINSEDPANICYTSGTTADPKGIILTHGNYIANIKQSTQVIDVTPDFTTLLILPWDHSFAHTVGLYSLIYKGASLAAVDGGKSTLEALKNIPINIKEIRPFFILSVPALAKNFKNNIEKSIAEKGRIINGLFKSGLAITKTYNGIGINKGKGFKILLKPLVFLFDRIIFKKIRDGFGGRLRYFIGGGALLDIEIQKFFSAIGIPMYQGYGLTEAAPVISSNSPSSHKMGSSGKPVSDLELIIADEKGESLSPEQNGEILVKGKNVMSGYWKNENASKETLKNGYLHTGDMGFIDNDGYLHINGRCKSLLIADDGEKYSPESLEEAMIFHSDIIEQIMLHNNQNPYTSALVSVNIEKLKKTLPEKQTNISEEDKINEILEIVKKEINKIRHDSTLSNEFPVRWLPSVFVILEEGFNEKNKFINSTLKMVRPKITAHYQDIIDSMYSKDGKKSIDVHNKRVLEKILI